MSATPRGDLPRNEGSRNFPYGPQVNSHGKGGHARKSILNLGGNTPDWYGRGRLQASSGAPTCSIHPTYSGERAPRSKAKGCTCRAVYEYAKANR